MMMRDNLFVSIISKQLKENSELLVRYAFSDDINIVIANDKYNSMNESENVIVHCCQDLKKNEKKLVNLRLYNLNFTSSKTILNEMKTPGMHHIVIDKMSF